MLVKKIAVNSKGPSETALFHIGYSWHTRTMLIPHDQLAPATLQALIEEFINREGTDYGEHEIPTKTKVSQIMRQLDEGSIIITYDEHSETCTLLPRWQASDYEQAQGS